ncbi:ABC transporter permease [Microbacterium protaetiae]|uniref:ABC transporter permease n=1 Tax=Microbacterium protaetiae TaxID=2509458 RepID=A0A4P6EA12_9MICO|nr:ABC transporter permease [Microbacterium protaetiae]
MTTPGRRSYRLTLPHVAHASLRGFLGGATAIWGVITVLFLAALIGIVTSLIGFPARDPDGSTQSPGPAGMFDVLNLAMSFAAIGAQLLAIVVGSDTIAGQFARGTIRASLTVVPKRGMLFAAHALTACGAVLAVGAGTGLVSGGALLGCAKLLGRPVPSQIMTAWLTGTGGLALGAAVLVLLTLALGALTRQRLVAVLVPIAVLYVVPIMMAPLAGTGAGLWASRLLPGTAMTALFSTRLEDGTVTVGTTDLPYWGALLVLAAWCAAIVPIAIFSFVRRGVTPTSSRSPRPRSPMQTAFVAASTTPATSTYQPAPYRVTVARLLASEWRKGWSLPSIRWIVVIAVLILIGNGAIRAASGELTYRGSTPAQALANEFSYAITDGVAGVALLLGAIAAILIAGEFHTGTAATTYISAPRRWQVVLAKLINTVLLGMSIALPGMILAAVLYAVIYAGRGYPPTAHMLSAGALTIVKALVFLLLIAVMSAGIAGLARRTVSTILTVAVLLVIGPALLNATGGLAKSINSPLAPIGNLARFLPLEGAKFYYPSLEMPFIDFDDSGIMHVSAEFGIVVAALWALIAAVTWFITDTRRAITTH